MAKISVPDMVIRHLTTCAASGECLGKALASLIDETGPIQVAFHNDTAFDVEPAEIVAAGTDFVVLTVRDEITKKISTMVSPLTALQWFDFSGA